MSERKYEYNYKTNIPQYIPKSCPPKLQECVDDSKYKELKAKILQSNVSDLEKKFLLCAARRHTVFNYSKIADYYASASSEMQELMEDSALVIIDFDDAIAKGYVKLNSKIQSILAKRIGDKNNEK